MGKISVVKILVKVVNCECGFVFEFCNECEVCCRIIVGLVMDVQEIDVVFNWGVEEICDFCEKVKYVLMEVWQKVYIIDEVYMLMIEVFNVLFKILEEFFLYVMFILVIIELYCFLVIIIFRCQ